MAFVNDCWRFDQDFRYQKKTVTLSVFSFCPAFSLPFWSTVLKWSFLKRSSSSSSSSSQRLTLSSSPSLGCVNLDESPSLNHFENVISEIDMWKSTTIKRWPIYRHCCPFVLLLVIIKVKVKLTKCQKRNGNYIFCLNKKSPFSEDNRDLWYYFCPKMSITRCNVEKVK